MNDPKDEIAKKLDEIVGTRYHEARSLRERIRLGLPKWILAAILAVIAVGAIFLVIESHRLPPTASKGPAKPVPIQILPPAEHKKKE